MIPKKYEIKKSINVETGCHVYTRTFDNISVDSTVNNINDKEAIKKALENLDVKIVKELTLDGIISKVGEYYFEKNQEIVKECSKDINKLRLEILNLKTQSLWGRLKDWVKYKIM